MLLINEIECGGETAKGVSVQSPEKTKKHINTLLMEVALAINGDYRITHNGVPHIIYRKGSFTGSIVYSFSSKKWKLFTPFPAIKQERFYFDTMLDMMRFINKEVVKSAQ